MVIGLTTHATRASALTEGLDKQPLSELVLHQNSKNDAQTQQKRRKTSRHQLPPYAGFILYKGLNCVFPRSSISGGERGLSWTRTAAAPPCGYESGIIKRVSPDARVHPVSIGEVALGTAQKNAGAPLYTRTKPRGMACSGSMLVFVIKTSSPV
jgi:hypothetical protein